MQTNVTVNTRKRNNKHFTNRCGNHKKCKQFVIEPGMRGFLCTCNFHEKGCITDAYKLLNQFMGEESASETIKSEISSASSIFDKNKSDESENVDKDEDISTALGREINELKAECEVPLSSRRFQVVDTGVKNMIFISSTLPDPLELVTKIVTELDTTKKQCTRFLLRLLPIEITCKAYMNDIKAKASALFEKYFSQEPKTFSIVFNRRNNNNIKRNEIIEDLAEIILRKNPGNKADLKNPEIAVIVEVIRGLCLLSIAPNYYRFKKYNLLEICNGTKRKDISNKSKVNDEKDSDTFVSNTQEAKEEPIENENLDIQIEVKEQVN